MVEVMAHIKFLPLPYKRGDRKIPQISRRVKHYFPLKVPSSRNPSLIFVELFLRIRQGKSVHGEVSSKVFKGPPPRPFEPFAHRAYGQLTNSVYSKHQQTYRIPE